MFMRSGLLWRKGVAAEKGIAAVHASKALSICSEALFSEALLLCLLIIL